MTEREIRKQQKKQGVAYPFPQERSKIITFATPETDGIGGQAQPLHHK